MLEAAVEMTPFVISFMVSLSEDGTIPTTIIRAAYSRLAPRIREHFNLVRWQREAFRSYETGMVTLHKSGIKLGQQRVSLTPIDGRELAKFLRLCLSFSLHGEVDGILNRLEAETYRAGPAILVPVTLICLRDLSPMLLSHGLAFDAARLTSYRRLYQDIITNYISTCVGNEPQKPNQWTRQPGKCPFWTQGSCQDCIQLNAFLEDPYHEVYE